SISRKSTIGATAATAPGHGPNTQPRTIASSTSRIEAPWALLPSALMMITSSPSATKPATIAVIQMRARSDTARTIRPLPGVPPRHPEGLVVGDEHAARLRPLVPRDHPPPLEHVDQ